MPSKYDIAFADAYDSKPRLLLLQKQIDDDKRVLKQKMHFYEVKIGELEYNKRQEFIKKNKAKQAALIEIRKRIETRIIEIKEIELTAPSVGSGAKALFVTVFNEIDNTYKIYYENGVFAGDIYREVHGEWVVILNDERKGYIAHHHLLGIAEHLEELNKGLTNQMS